MVLLRLATVMDISISLICMTGCGSAPMVFVSSALLVFVLTCVLMKPIDFWNRLFVYSTNPD